MSSYLVTGGAGFVGSHLVEALIAEGHFVRVLDNLSTGKQENLPLSAEFVLGDIADAQTALAASADVQGIFHLAANPSVPKSIEDPVRTFQTNVLGTLNVLNAARINGIRRVVITSSSAVYGDQPTPHAVGLAPMPMSPYGLHKLMGEKLAAQFFTVYGLQTVILRPFNIYGSRMPSTGAYASVIKLFLQKRQRGEPLIIFGDGRQTRDFVHVRDVVRAYMIAMTHPELGHGEVINIGTGKPYAVNDVATLIGGPVKHAPPRTGDILHSVADISLTKNLLGWEPVIAFEDGLHELLNAETQEG